MDVDKIISNILAGDFQDVKELIKNQPHKVNETNFNGKTLLMAASQRGSIELIELLIKSGAGLDTSDKDGNTALHYAVDSHQSDAVAFLVSRGTNVNKQNSEGNAPLHRAVRNNYQDVVKVLSNSRGNSILQVNQGNNDGWTPLHLACWDGHTDTVKLLLQQSETDVRAVDNDGWTPLHSASYNGHTDIVKLLLQQSETDVSAVDKYGWTPLHVACWYGRTDTVKLLLQQSGTDVSAVQKDGWTALHIASYNGQTDTVKLLLQQRGIDANMVDIDGRTPLHVAVENKHYDVVTSMLSQDLVNFEMKNKKNRTPLLEAVATGHIGIMHKLITKGAKVNAADNEGNSCLHLTVQRDAFHSEGEENISSLDKWCFDFSLEKKDRLSSIIVACYLFEFGARFHQKNKANKTPLDLVKNGNLKEKLQNFLPPVCTYCEVNYSSEFRPCGHSVICNECYINTKCRTCPRCRRPIRDIGEFESPKFKEKEVQSLEEATGSLLKQPETGSLTSEDSSRPVGKPLFKEKEQSLIKFCDEPGSDTDSDRDSPFLTLPHGPEHHFYGPEYHFYGAEYHFYTLRRCYQPEHHSSRLIPFVHGPVFECYEPGSDTDSDRDSPFLTLPRSIKPKIHKPKHHRYQPEHHSYTPTFVDNEDQTKVEPVDVPSSVDDHCMQISHFDSKCIMKLHSSKFRPLCQAVPQMLQFKDLDNDSQNQNTVLKLVVFHNGIVTYSPNLRISCVIAGGDCNVFHCSSPVSDMTRIGKDTVLATIPFRQKIVFISPSSFHIKSLDYSFYTISYFKNSTFVGTEIFGKTIYLIDFDKNKVEGTFNVKELVRNIVVGPQYHILVALSDINRISCYTIDGRHLFQLNTHSIGIPTDLSVYQNYFYAVQGNVIYKISPNGAVSQREIRMKARYICVGRSNIFLIDRFGFVHFIRTNKNFWPRLSYDQQDLIPSLINQIHVHDPSNIRNILPMSASSVVLIYRDRKAILVSDKGQEFGGKSLIFKHQPSVICRVDSNRFLVLFSEDRKLQYITCPQLIESDLIDVQNDYIQMCHMTSKRCLALTTSEGKVELHILVIKKDHVDIVNRITLEHDNVIIAATPINFVVVDKRKCNLIFYSSFCEELSKKHIDFNGCPSYVFADSLYFYVIFGRESLMICYGITGEKKWQWKLPSKFHCHCSVFQGTVYMPDSLRNRILLYRYNDCSVCHVIFKNPYNKKLHIRLEEEENDKLLIGEICHLANGQLVVSDIKNDCLLYISNEGDIVSRLSLPSAATDICRWDTNQIGAVLPLEKQLRVIGNVSKIVRTISVSHPYVRIRKLGDGEIFCYCDKPSYLDILVLKNQVERIRRINIPFLVKSLEIEKEALKLLIVGKKKVFFYKISRRRSRGKSISSKIEPSVLVKPSYNLYGDGGHGGSHCIKMVPSVILSQVKSASNLYGGCVDKLFVHLIDNSRVFAINEHNLMVRDHVTSSHLNMFIDLVDIFSRNICVSEMLSSTLSLQDLSVSDKAHEVIVPQCLGDKHPVEIGCLAVTDNNLIAINDNKNQNIKILTFDGQLVDSVKLNAVPRHMCYWRANTLVITTNKDQLWTLKVEFPSFLSTYQTENRYDCIACRSDNLLVCSCSSSSRSSVDGGTCIPESGNRLFYIYIDEIQSAVRIMKEIGLSWMSDRSNITHISVITNNNIILNTDKFITILNPNGQYLYSFKHSIYFRHTSMATDDTYLYITGRKNIYENTEKYRIVALLQNGEYKRIFLNERHYKRALDFNSINCNGPRFVANYGRYLYIEGVYKINRERFPVSRLQTNSYPVEVKDIDISDEGKTVVCEKANNGNVKLFDEDGKLLCHKDFGSLVGGVCFTGERNILVTVPNRSEVFQLKPQDLEKYKVWESRVPYGVIWRKERNIYWCVHINMTECDILKIDGDQIEILESISLLNFDSDLHFPAITSQTNKDIFGNELINKTKNSEDGDERRGTPSEIVGKCRLKVRRGNYIAESMIGIDEISVRRLPHRTAMFPLSFNLSGLLDSNSMFCFFNDFKLIMLKNNIVVLLYKCTLMITSEDGHLLYSQTFKKEAQDLCQWTDESFVVLFREGKQLMFFDTDLRLLKKITTEKPYNLMYKKSEDMLVCVFEDAPDECSNIPSLSYADMISIYGEIPVHISRVNLGKEGKVVALGVTSNEEIVVLKYKEDHYDICWYRDSLVRSQQLLIQDEPFPSIINNSLTIHGENVYFSDFNNNIHQVSVDGKCQIFLSSQEIEVCHIKAIHVSDYFIMVYGSLDNRFDGFFYYER